MTTRDLTSGLATAVQAGTVYPAILYEGEFDDGAGGSAFLRLWSGIGTLSWNSLSWTGAGNLIGINAIAESTDLRANAFEIWLSGVSSALVATALTAARKNRSGKLWLALFNAGNFVTPIADPYLLKRGRFDTIPIDDSGDTAKITARYEDRLATLSIPHERRYTNADQQLRAPGDGGFRYQESLQDAQFLLPVTSSG
jgi:hypothetical protein